MPRLKKEDEFYTLLKELSASTVSAAEDYAVRREQLATAPFLRWPTALQTACTQPCARASTATLT